MTHLPEDAFHWRIVKKTKSSFGGEGKKKSRKRREKKKGSKKAAEGEARNLFRKFNPRAAFRFGRGTWGNILL